MPPADSPAGNIPTLGAEVPKNRHPPLLGGAAASPLTCQRGQVPPACPWPHSIFTTLTFRGRTAWSAGRAGGVGGERQPPARPPSLCSPCLPAGPMPPNQDGDGFGGPLQAPLSPVLRCHPGVSPQLCFPGVAQPVLLPTGSRCTRHGWAALSRCHGRARSPSLQIWLVSTETRFGGGKVNFLVQPPSSSLLFFFFTFDAF